MTAQSQIAHAHAVDWLAAQEPGCATAVVFDPPYAVDTSSVRGKDDGAAGQVFGAFGLFHQALTLSAKALRPGGIVLIFCEFKRTPDLGYIATISGLKYATCVAWVKNGVGTGGMLRGAWDPVMIYAKGRADAVDDAAVRNVVETFEGATVVRAKRPAGRAKVHLYQKPPEVYEHILGRVCRPGDLVLDPFAGSGSSRDAAGKLGLEWCGCDIDPQFAEPTP